MSDHFVHAFYIGELFPCRVSIKQLSYYTFLENILVEGKARNKLRPVNERKSSYISGAILQWFTDYLSNRKQQVVLPGLTSELSTLKAGVPQGSILVRYRFPFVN